MTHTFHEYAPYRGDIPGRKNGVLMAMEHGETTAYSLDALQPRGVLFIGAGVEVYGGMIIGQHAKDNDLDVNPCKGKKLTNVRASGTDDAIKLTPPRTPHPGAGAGVHRRGRTGGGDPQVDPAQEKGAGPEQEKEGRKIVLRFLLYL